MTPLLTGFGDELVKLSASRKNPYSRIQNQADKLLRGNLSDYVGTSEVRHPPIPRMEQVAQTPAKIQKPKIDFRAPRPPRVK